MQRYVFMYVFVDGSQHPGKKINFLLTLWIKKKKTTAANTVLLEFVRAVVYLLPLFNGDFKHCIFY